MATLQERLNKAVQGGSSAPAAASSDSLQDRLSKAMNAGTTTQPKVSTTAKEDDRNFFEKLSDFVGYTSRKAGAGFLEGTEGVANAAGNYWQLVNQSALRQAESGSKLAAQIVGNNAAKEAASNTAAEVKEGIEKNAIAPIVNYGDKAVQKVEEKYADVPLSGATKLVGNVAQGLSGMVPAAISNAILPGSGLAVMTTGAIGNATQEAKKEGADDLHALAYGLAVGAVEAATEKLLGGMTLPTRKGAKPLVKGFKLIKESAGEAGEEVVRVSIDDAIKNLIKARVNSPAVAAGLTSIVSAFGEGAEEFVSEFATALANKGLIGTDERTSKEILTDAGYSALVGGIVGSIANIGDIINTGKEVSAKQAAQQAADQVAKEVANNSFVLQNSAESDTVDPTQSRVLRAREMAANGATSSEIFSETGLVLTGKQFMDGFGGPIVGSVTDERGADSGIDVETSGRNGGTVSQHDEGRAEGLADSVRQRTEWEKLGRKKQQQAVEIISRAYNEYGSGDLDAYLFAFGGNEELAKRMYDDYVKGDVVFDQWRSLLGETKSVVDELGSSLPDLGAAPAGFTINEGEQVETQSKSTVQNKNLNEQQREEVKPGTHERISEAESVHRAQAGLYTDSEGNIVNFEESVEDLLNKEGALSGVESDRLQLLLAEAGRRNDIDSIKRITKKLQEDKSFVAQALQATQKWIDYSPASRLAGILTAVDDWANTHRSKSGERIKLPDFLIEAYLNAESETVRDDIVSDMQAYVAQDTKATLLEKWNALRYTNMLGNFKTQGRNAAGNVASYVMYRAKDEVANLAELLFAKNDRTKSGFVGKEWMQAAKADFDNAKGDITKFGKYKNDNARSSFIAGVDEQRNIFSKNNPLEYYRQGTNWAMEKGDEIFSKSAYARSLAGYLKANGVEPAQLSAGNVDQKLLDKARTYAIKQAQEVTFRDSNTFSDWVSRIGRRPDTPKAVKAIAEGIAPFRRTPANVMVRVAEYSPVGLLNTAVKAVQAKKPGSAISASDIIETASKGLTGTAILALGYLLADHGLLRATGDDEAEDIDALMNRQDYSLIIPGVGSYTMDWLTPASLIMFTGAELFEILSDEGFTWADVEGAITSIADPMINMSMLSGINDTLDNIKYSDNNLIQLAATSALSYLTQGLTNTLAGQIERIAEPERMSTYVDKENAVPDWLERNLGKAMAKTPGVEYNQTEYLDEFGNTESNGSLTERIFENLFSPGYFSTGNEGKRAYDFAQQAYESLNYNPAPAAYAESTLSEGAKKYTLTQAEKEKYQKVRGQTAEDLLTAASRSSAYASLDNKEKVKVLQHLKSQASEKAKIAVLDGRHVDVDQSAAEKAIAALGAGDMVTYYSYWVDMDTPLGYANNSHPNWQKFQTVAAMGFDDETSMSLIEAISPETGRKFRAALDEGVPLSDAIDYYQAIEARKANGKEKSAGEKIDAAYAIKFKNSNSQIILDSIF